MPWKATTMFKEKQEFIQEYLTGRYTISDLCRGFEISRPTAYRLINRYKIEGDKAFHPVSKAPHSHPNETRPEVQTAILYFRNKHKKWGARKIRRLLLREFNSEVVPSSMTIHSILNRNGLVIPKKRFRRVKPINPIYDAKNVNDVWSTDYKGKFLMRNKKYCHPLTIVDKKSRFILTAKGFHRETFNNTKAGFTKVFKEFGLPKQIHSDNGSPFGYTRAVRRFSRLSYWFIDLGIEPVFSDPGQPQQNGKHERMLKDLKAECTDPPAQNLRGQQRKLNHFVNEYNHIRPHEALKMKTPAELYQPSERLFPNRIEPWIYEDDLVPRRINKTGGIRWGAKHWVYVSSSLIGKDVGIQEIGNGIWRMFYRNIFLGYFDTNQINEKTRSIFLYDNYV